MSIRQGNWIGTALDNPFRQQFLSISYKNNDILTLITHT